MAGVAERLAGERLDHPLTTRVDISVSEAHGPTQYLLVGTQDGADFSGTLMQPPFKVEILVYGDTKIVIKEATAADVAALKAA